MAAPVLLAFDDTDGPAGGCTTHLAFHVLLALPHLGLRSLPRLVRLNPNVPWKTRGNAAVVLDLCVPEGPQARAGELRGNEVLVFPAAPPAPMDAGVLEVAWQVVKEQSRPDADPGVALFEAPPAGHWYDAAVRSIVDRQDAVAEAPLHRGGRGVVGAMAAAAWPGPPASCEFIAYREPHRWGSPRDVDPKPLRGLDASGVTFHTWDADEDVPACIPSTPCPVLLGLRGRDPDVLRDAAVRATAQAAGEAVDGWLLWATNQASGDHVSAVETLLEAPEAGTVEVDAEVVGSPKTRQGGHVFAAMEDPSGIAFEAAAFEPTKGFRDVVRALRPGDRIAVVGAFEGGVVRLEKLHVRSLAQGRRKTANPDCPDCGDRMKSKGEGAGFRCPSCGATAGADDASWAVEERGVRAGSYEVPVMARRHLHRPLAWGTEAATTTH